ncbi:MAG: hypothetical protein M3N91_00935 [Pseudomonadota bacterium]|nr:hypothetical protein [Pseudomonadota bacterium]
MRRSWRHNSAIPIKPKSATTALRTASRVASCISVALWGARHPDQVEAALGVGGWSLNAAHREVIEHIVNTAVLDPVGPEFMAPPQRDAALPVA